MPRQTPKCPILPFPVLLMIKVIVNGKVYGKLQLQINIKSGDTYLNLKCNLLRKYKRVYLKASGNKA